MGLATAKDRREHASAGGTAVPRYLDLAGELIDAIRRGVYPVGSQFPSEHQLCQRHAVSRFTVRAALDTLRRQGYVTRKPKVGTLVTAAQPPVRFSVLSDGTFELVRPVKDGRFELLGLQDIEADAALAGWLDCEAGSPWIRLEGLHVSPDSPRAICLARYYLPPAQRRVLRGLEGAGPRALPLHARLERTAPDGISAVRQELSLEGLERREARALSVPAGTPALRLARRMFGADANRSLYAVVSLHPAGQFRFSQTLLRET